MYMLLNFYDQQITAPIYNLTSFRQKVGEFQYLSFQKFQIVFFKSLFSNQVIKIIKI